MEADLKIRDYESRDIEQITILMTELGYPNTVDFFKERFEFLLHTGLDRILIAESDGCIHGIITLHFMPLPHLPGNLCRVVALAVKSESQRQGVGAKLMVRAEEIAREKGCSKIELTSGEQRNDAHAFYRAIGFEEKSRRFTKDLTSED
jgi:ribosomal protein S18 acetylase RimI-like enzyme